MTIRVKLSRSPGFGNLVSKSERKVKRKFGVNKQKSKFFSKVLNQFVYINSNTSVFRTILAYGCIDRYLNLCKPPQEFRKVQKLIYKNLSSKNKNKKSQ